MRTPATSQAILIALLSSLLPSICTAIILPNQKPGWPTLIPAEPFESGTPKVYLPILPAITATATTTSPPSTFSTSTLKTPTLEKKSETTTVTDPIPQPYGQQPPPQNTLQPLSLTTTPPQPYGQQPPATNTLQPFSLTTTPPHHKTWHTAAAVDGYTFTNPSDFTTICEKTTTVGATTTRCEYGLVDTGLGGGFGVSVIPEEDWL